MHVIEIVLFIAGIALLVVGYRKNARNLLATAALLLLLTGAGPQMWEGFVYGMEHANARTL
jgi:hypothetical protein